MNQPNLLDVFKNVCSILGGETHPGEAFNAAVNNGLVRRLGADEGFPVEIRFVLDVFASKPAPPQIEVNWPAIGSVNVHKAFECADLLERAANLAMRLHLFYSEMKFDWSVCRAEQQQLLDAAKRARESLPVADRQTEKIMELINAELSS